MRRHMHGSLRRNQFRSTRAQKRHRRGRRTEAACVREDIARRLSKIDQSIITNGAIFKSWPQNPKRLQVKSSHPARISEQAFT
jgi:hypothetical protein